MTERCVSVLATPLNPGAVAIIQLHGDVVPVLIRLTGRDGWPVGRLALASLAGIDEGLAGRIADEVAQVMPHGGVRVVQRLLATLDALGAPPVATPDPALLYPEAADRFETLALAAVARVASPRAIDLLLDQPRRWRAAAPPDAADHARSRRLNRLLDPPRVVLAGPANVGKSTLTNTLLGRDVSIALDRPGTTRDYTAARVDLAGLVVDWHDTPGLRVTDDPAERAAQEIARDLLAAADLVVAMTDADHDWPDLPRAPDLRLAAKSDLATRDDVDLAVSAVTGAGMAELVATIRDRLVPPADLAHPGPWLFDERLVR